MTRHYHVGSNTPGYSPECDVMTATTKREATSLLADEIARYRDSEADLPRADRRTGHGSAKSGYVHFSRPGDPYDLGLSFWWSACDQSDCETDED